MILRIQMRTCRSKQRSAAKQLIRKVVFPSQLSPFPIYLDLVEIGIPRQMADFDSAIESRRPSQNFSRKTGYLAHVRAFSNTTFMLYHVAKKFQAISTVTKLCRRLRTSWTQHRGTSCRIRGFRAPTNGRKLARL